VTNADWWTRVVQARTERDDLRPQRVWTLHKGAHAAAIDLKAVPGIGAEIVPPVDGQLRKTRFVPLTRAGRTGRRDCRHADDVRGEGVDLASLSTDRAEGRRSFQLPSDHQYHR